MRKGHVAANGTALLAALVVLASTTVVPAAAPETGPVSLPPAHSYLPADYPHLASYNGFIAPWQTPFYANDDLVVTYRGAPIGALMQANPHVLTLLYERTIQADLCCMRDLYGLDPQDIPPGWWLVTPGSRLSGPIDPVQAWIPVADPRPFKRCQDIMIDGESMHVWDVAGHLLHVLRGYYSGAARHAAGARVVIHYSYRRDLSNCKISGPVNSMRPWSFNLSTACPRWHGQTWVDFLARRIATLVLRDGWRGIFYDNMPDFPPSPLVDVNNDGVPDGGVLHGVNVWRAGEQRLLEETRQLLPHVPMIVNGDLQINGLADGREMEGFPLIPGMAISAALDTYLADNEADMPLTIVNGDSNAHPRLFPPEAQLTTGIALLGDGYAAYDEGWLRHGYPWWIDEYDGGAGSALSRTVDAATMFLPVAHSERFAPGNVVLFDQEAAQVLRIVPGALLVQRGLWGTPQMWHPAGTTVTTLAQRTMGHGYLGRPLGPARLIPTANWSRAVLPLGLVRKQTVQKGKHNSFVSPVTSQTEIHETYSRVFYDPFARQTTLVALSGGSPLRTLTFSARGPAGQHIWLRCRDKAVPLTLRPGWHDYVLPVCGVERLVIGTGQLSGELRVRNMRLINLQAFVWRRDFTHGIVVVNPTDVPQRLVLEHDYRVLSGDQNPYANDGGITHAAILGRYRAQIFLRL